MMTMVAIIEFTTPSFEKVLNSYNTKFEANRPWGPGDVEMAKCFTNRCRDEQVYDNSYKSIADLL